MLYFRVPYSGINDYGIANEKGFYVKLAKKNNPVTLEDYKDSLFYQQALNLKEAYLEYEKKNKVRIDKYVALSNIGISGFLLGSDFYIFDLWCIADPIGARLEIQKRARPGHEKKLSKEWIFARIGLINDKSFTLEDKNKILYAKKTLECGILKEYLDSIHSDLNWSKFINNIINSYKYSKIRIPEDPYRAYLKFCKSKK
ncbi:MAG: hypothetical protein ACPL1F_07760 [bacterium]